MKVYIAGPLCTEQDREFVEKLAKICKRLGLETFLPHRDGGLWKSIKDTKKIAEADLKGFENCDFVIASLNGFNIGAGTAWEMGYAYSREIPIIAIKTDRKIEESIEELSAIIAGTTKITTNLENLEQEIRKMTKKIRTNQEFL